MRGIEKGLCANKSEGLDIVWLSRRRWEVVNWGTVGL